MMAQRRFSLASVAWKAIGLLLLLTAMAGTASASAGPPDVPEIDPGSILSGMTLLSGGLMILIDRRRAK
ncbi:MAG: hypothetical protein NVSMB9_23480 [Isosphaeraceae bacterium]